MKQSSIGLIVGVVIVVILILIGNPFYTVYEHQQVVITQFGKPVGKPVVDSGLHIKMPFIQKVNYFEKRILEWDGYPGQIPTRDKKYISVDATARWRIIDALRFFKTVNDERGGQAALDDVMDSAVRKSVNTHDLLSIVRSSNRILEEERSEDSQIGGFSETRELESIRIGRDKIRKEILTNADKLNRYGIELIDVRIKRVNYIEDVRRKVYDRMITERKRAAEQYRSEGRGIRAEVEGRTEKELKQILSDAYKESQTVKGEADAKSTKIFADAYNKDPEFFAFLKTLETYHKTVDKETTIILTTDGEYYQYLKETTPRLGN